MKRNVYIASMFFIVLFNISTVAFAENTALKMLKEIYQKGPIKEKPLTEQVNKIWKIFYEKEPSRWEDSNYQDMMIDTTLGIQEKYGVIWFNPLLIHSFSSTKYLIDELCRRNNHEEAIRYCYVIAAMKVEQAADDPVMLYFSKRASEIFKNLMNKKGSVKLETITFLFCTLMYAPYDDADKDSWDILITLGNKVGSGYYMYLDAISVIYWRLKKELSNDQVGYIFNLLNEIDKKKRYKPDFVLLVAADKKYALNLIDMNKYVLQNKEILDIQNEMERFIKDNIFERGDF